MSIRKLVPWITFLAVFAMAAQVSVDTDTWWHLRAGQWIVEQRAVPQTDPFSYTRAGAAWQYPGWLVEAPMYAIYRLAGPGGLNLWTAAMVTLAFYFVWRTLSGGPFLRAFTVVLAASASGVYWAARPYLVTFVLAAVFLALLEDFRWRRGSFAAGWKGLLWLPALMVVWANSHGGFAAGCLIWAAYLAGAGFEAVLQARRGEAWLMVQRLLIVGLLMAAAVCVNPSGPVMLLYPFKTAGIQALQEYIQEWQPLDLQSRQAQPFIWLLLLSFAAVGASRRRLALVDFLLFAGFGYMALLAGRNVALFALAAPMVLTRHAAPALEVAGRAWGWRARPERRPTPAQAKLNGMLLGVLALAVLVKAGSVAPGPASAAVFEQTLPVGAVDFIQETRPPGRIFNSYNWGGYLLWELPEYPVFIDGRTDLYDDKLVNEWLQVVRAEPGWDEVLDRWEVRLVLLEPGMPVTALLEPAGWQKLYADEQAVVFGR